MSNLFQKMKIPVKYIEGVFAIFGILLGSCFLLQYLHRWFAGLGNVVPPNDSANFVLVDVIKLINKVPLYGSTQAMPSDYLYGPFPCVAVYLLKPLVPFFSILQTAHCTALFSALIISLCMGILSVLLFPPAFSMGSGKRILLSISVSLLTLVSMPKTYFLNYHHEPIAIALALFCLVLMLVRIRGRIRYSMDLLLGALAAAAFLTKSSYLSVLVFCLICYVVFLPSWWRSCVVLLLGFSAALGAVIFIYCSPSGYVWWTLELPLLSPRYTSELLSGFYYPIVMALFAVVALAFLGLRFCPVSKPAIYVALIFAIVITCFATTAIMKVGGGAQTVVNPIFAWFPLLIPLYTTFFRQGVYSVILIVSCCGLQTDAMQASVIKKLAVDRKQVMTETYANYPNAIYWTRVNWPSLVTNRPPVFVLNSLVDLTLALPLTAGSEAFDEAVRPGAILVIDDYFEFHALTPAPWIPNKNKSAIVRLQTLLSTQADILATYGNPSSLGENVSPYTKVYRMK